VKGKDEVAPIRELDGVGYASEEIVGRLDNGGVDHGNDAISFVGCECH
jgi:hypothetical protein